MPLDIRGTLGFGQIPIELGTGKDGETEWFPTDGMDPAFDKYGAPVITYTPYGVTTPLTEILSAYDPIVFECTWAGDGEIVQTELGDNPVKQIMTNIRMKAVLTANENGTVVTLGTQVKSKVSIGGADTYRFNFADMLKTELAPEYYNNISSDQINSTTGLENIATRFNVTFSVLFIDAQGYEREDDETASGTYYVTNAIIQHDESNRLFDITNDYVLTDSNSKFLTKAPNNKLIAANENEQLSFLYVGTNHLVLNYQTYDLGGNANTLQTKTQKLITDKHGTFTISDNGASTLIDDFANISKIDVYLEDTAATQVSEIRTYIMDHKCNDGYRLWWHNSLGGFDKFTFNAHTNKTFNVDSRINFVQPFSTTPTTIDRSKGTMKVNGNSTYSASSQFMANSLDMFIDLLNSTEVLFQPDTTSTTLYPAVIKSMEQTEADSDGLITINIEFETSQTHKSHIG